MGKLILASLFCLGSVAFAAAETDIDSNSKPVINAIDGNWIVKSMYCSTSGVDVLAKHKAANITQSIQIKDGMIVETAHYKSCDVSGEHRIYASKWIDSGYSNFGNTTSVKLRLEFRRMSMLSHNEGEVGCKIAPLVEEAGPTQDIFSYFDMGLTYVSPGKDDNGTKLERMTLTATTWHTKDGNKYCEPSDTVVTTLVRDTSEN